MVKLSSAGIYSITALSGNCYIGSTSNFTKRWSRHRSSLRRKNHENPGLTNAAAKYGVDALHFDILLVCRREDLVMYEQLAIDALCPKYNAAPVAGSCLGYRHTDQARKNMADAHRPNSGYFLKGHKLWIGRKHTAKTRAKMSEGMKKRPPSIVAIEAMRASNIGRRPSQWNIDRIANLNRGGMSMEHRRRMSDAKKRNWSDPAYRREMLARRLNAKGKRVVLSG